MCCAVLCSGKLEAGTYALNANKGKKERIGRLMLMHANNRLVSGVDTLLHVYSRCLLWCGVWCDRS
jgi:hypothetical protein